MEVEKNIENVILFQIEKTSKMAKMYSQREFDKINLGITIEQWILLKVIQESEQLSQKELADKSSRDPASITRTLDLLEKKGFIIRRRIPENRRQYEIELTPSGADFVALNMKMIHEHRILSIKGFSNDELLVLKAMLLRIQNNVK